MNPRILAVAAAVLVLLCRWHVTIWLAGHPVVTVPAVVVVVTLGVMCAAGVVLIVRRLHEHVDAMQWSPA